MSAGKRRRRWDAIFTAALAAIVVASAGAAVTDLGPWYQNLKQPSWKLPDIAFGPVWTLIFALWALAGYESWRRMPDRESWGRVLGLFTANAFFNVAWSVLFFQFQRPDWALFGIVPLWLTILLSMLATRRFAPRAGLYLAPYLVWVTFAGVLNAEVVRLNGPFG
jgi:tryptophan-rich sensory protein